jgi:putative DNA primase/helicase
MPEVGNGFNPMPNDRIGVAHQPRVSFPRQAGDVIRLSAVDAEPVTWLWENLIGRGFISIVAGKPGRGKGLFAHYLTAQVTRRGESVIFSSWEESRAKMVRPRLDAAGADLDRVIIPTGLIEIPRDNDRIRQMIRAEKVTLVVLDTASAHLGASIYNDQAVKRALGPIMLMAEELDVAFVLLHHVTKGMKGDDPMYAIGGSGGGLTAVARSIFIFGTDERDDPAYPNERRLALVKSNMHQVDQTPSFIFDIELANGVPMLEAVGPSEDSSGIDDARLMLQRTKNETTNSEAKIESAAEWLIDFLRDGPQTGSSGFAAANSDGHAKRTIRRAADKLGLVKGRGPGATWALPDGLLEALDENGGDDD